MRYRFSVFLSLALLALCAPAVSAGDPEIAFDDRDGIKVMDRDGGNVQLIYPNPISGGDSSLFPIRPGWSPDGGSVVFEDAWDIVAVDVSTGAQTVIAPFSGWLNTTPPIQYHNLKWPAWSPAVDASGTGEIAAHTYIYDEDGDAVHVLTAIDDQGSGEVSLVYTSDRPFPSLSAAPTWSPDGAKIATIERTHAPASDPQHELIIIERATGSKTAIPLVGYVAPADPEWSRDGLMIAFADGTTRKTTKIFTLDLGNGHVTQRVKGVHPSWSPTGHELLFGTFNGKINRLVLSSGAVETLGSGQNPVWARAALCADHLDCDLGELCCDGSCATPVCEMNSDCDDGDGCTADSCADGATCAATCANDPVCGDCVPTHEKEKGPRCQDGLDNDCDGLIDGNDPDC